MRISRGALRLLLICAVLASGLLVGSGATMAANNSEQVVFSGVAGQDSTFAYGSPIGFWVWCESDSLNPYEGNCVGALYVYALGLTKHVSGDDAITENGGGSYTMHVQSSDGSFNCWLTNTAPVTHGPTNTVTVSCSAPSGSASTTTAVVNVTGP
jgi:hypothetical protein